MLVSIQSYLSVTQFVENAYKCYWQQPLLGAEQTSGLAGGSDWML